MAKIRITDTNRWFDNDAAIEFAGDRPVGSFGGQELYYTRSGAWVLRAWSQWGDGSCELISQESAIDWLIANGYLDPDYHVFGNLPAKVAGSVRQGIAAAEV